jgi:DNA-binding transcriptional MerR regulator
MGGGDADADGMMTTPARYPIRVVSRMTGIAVDTLRAWERRYQAVVPDRGERGRTYTDRHVDRLKQLSVLVAEGHAIGSIAGLSDAELRRLRRGSDAAARPVEPVVDLEPLFRAMRRYDLEAIDTLFYRHSLLLPPTQLIFNVVIPALRETGAQWEAGTISPAHEHLVSGIIRGILGGILRAMPRPGASRVVFATPSGERHELGLLCGAILAASAGYSVLFLGPDLPAADIAHAVRKSEAKALVLSGTAPGIDYAALRSFTKLPASVDIWVGGARADDLRAAVGPRARNIDSLEELRGLLDRHAA